MVLHMRCSTERSGYVYGGEAGAGEDSVSVNDSEHDLVQKAYIYITEGTYPGGATANEKRVIRKKAKKFAVRNGELVYKKVICARKVLQLRRQSMLLQQHPTSMDCRMFCWGRSSPSLHRPKNSCKFFMKMSITG